MCLVNYRCWVIDMTNDLLRNIHPQWSTCMNDLQYCNTEKTLPAAERPGSLVQLAQILPSENYPNTGHTIRQRRNRHEFTKDLSDSNITNQRMRTTLPAASRAGGLNYCTKLLYLILIQHVYIMYCIYMYCIYVL